MSKPLNLQISSDLEQIKLVNDQFDGFARSNGLSDNIRRSVSLVLDEVLNNTMSYGYDESAGRSIELRIELAVDRLAVTVTDDGKAFNPFKEAAPDTAISLEDRELGGLGIHLVRSLMDEVTYYRRKGRNVVVLVKHLENKMPTPAPGSAGKQG